MQILEESNLYIDYLASDHIPFPKSLQIELTSLCNLKCIMCPKTVGASRTEPDKVMDQEVLDYITSSMLPYVQRIDVVGDGEPLMAKDLLFQLLEIAGLFKIPVTICSNGVLLTEDIAEKLVELDLDDLNISLDAATAETYKKIRGGDFETVINNIEHLDKVKQKAGKQIPHVHLSMVAMRDNIEELPELMNLAKLIGAESVTVQAMGEESEEMKGQSAFLHHRDLAEEVLYKCLIEAEMEGYPLKLWPDQLAEMLSTSEDLGLFLTGQAPPPGDPDQWRKNCSFLWSTPFITTNGDVRPCCADLPPIGNLKDVSFQKIWYSKAYAALRKNMLTGHLPDSCLNCPGMGWRKVLTPKTSLIAADTSLDYFPGWYGSELEEREFRWSREKSVLYLRRMANQQFLLLQLRKATLKGAAPKGTITLNNSEPIPFNLFSTDWETLEIPLPALENEEAEEELIRVELSLPHTIRPSDVDETSRDSRALGVKFARAWIEGWPQKVVFGQKLILLGYEFVPENWIIDGDVLFRTFWRSLDKMQLNFKSFLHFTREGDSGPVSSPIRRKLGFTRKDFFQADHLLMTNGQPSSNWEPGTFIAHEHRLPVPEDIRAGHYRIELGIYPEGAPKERVSITRSDRPVEKDRTLLGTVLVSER